MPLWSDASGFAPLGGFNVALCGASLPSILYDLLPHAEWDPVAGPSTFGYDLSGRRTTLVTHTGKYTYSYDAADEMLVQQTPTGSVSYGYDPNGSRIYQQSATARTTSLWDPRNRLQQVTLPTGSLYTQTYRPDDMRLSESSSTGISTMVWSNNDVLGMVGTQSGSPMQQVFALTPVSVPVSVSGHAGGGGIGLPLAPSPTPSLVRAMGKHADGSAINRAYHLDNQGGVLAITTATGSIEADYHTDSWGNVISGTAADNPYVYLGGLGYWQDSSLSLNYVRARWQEASTGSWLSVDSVRSEPRYLYAHNSPTRLVDPSGRQDLLDAIEYAGKAVVRTATGAYESAKQDAKAVAGALTPIVVMEAGAHAQLIAQIKQTLDYAYDPAGALTGLMGQARDWWKAESDRIGSVLDRTGVDSRLNILLVALPMGPVLAAGPELWNNVRKSFNDKVRPFIPPHPLSGDGYRWFAGFAWGMVDSLAEMAISLVHLFSFKGAVDFFSLVTHIFKEWQKKGILAVIEEVLGGIWHHYADLFTRAANSKSPFDQGEAVAGVVAEILTLVLTIVTAVGGAVAIVKFIKEGGSLVELALTALKEGPRAAGEKLHGGPTASPHASLNEEPHATGNPRSAGGAHEPTAAHPPSDAELKSAATKIEADTKKRLKDGESKSRIGIETPNEYSNGGFMKDLAGQVGRIGEKEGIRFLEEQGFTDVIQIQNNSGHGVDIIAMKDGKVWRFDAKATQSEGSFPSLQGNQRPIGAGANSRSPGMGAKAYIRDRLERAVIAHGHWANAVEGTADKAQEMLDLLETGIATEERILEVRFAPKNTHEKRPDFSFEKIWQ